MNLRGVITKGIGGFYYVKAEGQVYECKARGKFRREGIVPMVGDRVAVSIKNSKGSVDEIYERKNFLIRPAVANIDQMIVVAALHSPEPNPMLIDSFLIIGEHIGVDVILCFNKFDLANAKEQLVDIYKNAGYKVLVTSASKNEGIEELKELLYGKMTAFAGNSGVGKSSLLNLLGLSYELKTGLVSKKIQRGRHTTRHVELIEFEKDSYVFDTPGFSDFEMPKIPAQELADYFIEFNPYKDLCRFRRCSHTGETGCAVCKALADGKISDTRYKSYKALYEEMKKNKPWEK